MSNLRQAAQQALEAMDNLHRTGDTQVFDLCHRETTEALRAALAEPHDPVAYDGWVLREVLFDNGEPVGHRAPEQEPVAWMDREGDLYKMPEIKNWAPPHTMLYTAPPHRKPLTDEEIGKAWSVADGEHNASAAVKRRITRAIEHAHGIKGEA